MKIDNLKKTIEKMLFIFEATLIVISVGIPLTIITVIIDIIKSLKLNFKVLCLTANKCVKDALSQE